MNSNDLPQLWQDALDDVPTEAALESLRLHGQKRLRAKRRRRQWLKVTALVAITLIAVAAWRYRLPQHAEITHLPVPVAPTPTPPQQIAAQAPNQITMESVPLKEFLAMLPHHGYMTIENDRGRFLVVVDNETGESVTTRLSKDDTL